LPPPSYTGGGFEPEATGIRFADVTSLSVADERAVRELYREHAAALTAFVRSLVGGDTPRAQDIVQETLLRAWQHPEAFSQSRPGGSHPRAWLFTVARNLVIDSQRARQVRPQEVAELSDDQAPVEEQDFDRVLTAYEVADALAGLSTDHRAVISELYYRDHSVAQTAEALGVPQGTVKSRAYYALRALRVACEERGITP
jgi:RNA polymerase sigma-70 factor (ECF subfamily)